MAKTIVQGTVVKMGAVTVGGVNSTTFPGPVKTEVEVTDFASTASEFIPGLADYGTVTVEGLRNYADAGQAALQADGDDVSAPARAFTIEATRQGFKVDFNAFVRSFATTGDAPNSAFGFSADLRVTGLPVVTALP